MGLQVLRELGPDAAEGARQTLLGDIDVLAVDLEHATASCVECKGKLPSGVVTAEEVEKWLSKTSAFAAYVKQRHSIVQTVNFEIWTTGTFHADALARLEQARQHRTKSKIDWLDGDAIIKLSLQLQLKVVTKALRDYFLPIKPIES
jgi:hypothetical protein